MCFLYTYIMTSDIVNVLCTMTSTAHLKFNIVRGDKTLLNNSVACLLCRINCHWSCYTWLMTLLEHSTLFGEYALLSLFSHRYNFPQRSAVDVFIGVWMFVCLFVRIITSERLNVGRWNLAVRCIVQKSHPSSNVKVKGQGHQGQKRRKKPDESSPLTMHSHAWRGDGSAHWRRLCRCENLRMLFS